MMKAILLIFVVASFLCGVCMAARGPILFRSPYSPTGQYYFMYPHAEQRLSYQEAQSLCRRMHRGGLVPLNDATRQFLLASMTRLGTGLRMNMWIGSWNGDHFNTCICMHANGNIAGTKNLGKMMMMMMTRTNMLLLFTC